jgi:hypothetical protein
MEPRAKSSIEIETVMTNISDRMCKVRMTKDKAGMKTIEARTIAIAGKLRVATFRPNTTTGTKTTAAECTNGGIARAGTGRVVMCRWNIATARML